MEQFATEEQQVEAIKRFWKENGMAIVLGAVIGLGGLWGWRYYNETQIAEQEFASNNYQIAVQALDANASGFTTAVDYVKENEGNGYDLLASLLLAKEAVERKDLPEAAKHLTYVATKSSDPAIANIANIRLARVQVEMQEMDKALATLDKVTDEAFAAQVQERKGDVFVAQNLFDKARAAYSAALEKDANNRNIQMKLDNLAVAANG